MPDDNAALDPPDPDHVYRNYLRTCAMLNVKPETTRVCIRLMREWSATFERGGKPLH